MAHETRASRFELVTAGHRFLLRALPLHQDTTERALKDFERTVSGLRLPEAEMDAVLLRCLRVFDRHTGGHLPSLVDRYLRTGSELVNLLASFSLCIHDVLRRRGIGNPKIQRAIAVIDREYQSPHLRQHTVAHVVGSTRTSFATEFKRQTGSTFGQFLKEYRLGRAAAMLRDTRKSVKEIWASVGYNHPSNFDHDFKRRYGLSPSAYRLRSVTAVEIQEPFYIEATCLKSPTTPPRAHVLLVDDDTDTCAIVQRHLMTEGYRVSAVSTAVDALRLASHAVPDVILLDLRLPDMDGLQCLRELVARRLVPPAGVALFTADWNVYDVADDIHSLGGVILSKLCDLESIVDTVSYLSRSDTDVAAR